MFTITSLLKISGYPISFSDNREYLNQNQKTFTMGDNRQDSRRAWKSRAGRFETTLNARTDNVIACSQIFARLNGLSARHNWGFHVQHEVDQDPVLTWRHPPATAPTARGRNGDRNPAQNRAAAPARNRNHHGNNRPQAQAAPPVRYPVGRDLSTPEARRRNNPLSLYYRPPPEVGTMVTPQIMAEEEEARAAAARRENEDEYEEALATQLPEAVDPNPGFMPPTPTASPNRAKKRPRAPQPEPSTKRPKRSFTFGLSASEPVENVCSTSSSSRPAASQPTTSKPTASQPPASKPTTQPVLIWSKSRLNVEVVCSTPEATALPRSPGKGSFGNMVGYYGPPFGGAPFGDTQPGNPPANPFSSPFARCLWR